MKDEEEKIKQKRKNIKCLPFLPSVHRLTLYYCPFLLLCRDSRSAYEMVLRTFLLIALNMKICALIPYFILDWRKARCDFTFRLRWPSTFSPRFFLSSAYCRWWYTLFGDARFMTVIMKFVEYINLYTCTLDNAIYCFIFISVACLHSSTLKLQPNADLIEQLKWKESPK